MAEEEQKEYPYLDVKRFAVGAVLCAVILGIAIAYYG